MVVTRNTDTRLDGLEKVAGDLEKKSDSMNDMLNEVNIQLLTTNERVSALGSQLETFMTEMRAALAKGIPTDSSDGHGSNTTLPGGTPPMTIPTFDGPDAIAWLARAEQYFLVSKIPPENRLRVAMVALAGPALPWIQLLMRRIPDLSWDRFTQELMKRFGDNMALDGYEAFASTRHDGSLVEFVAAFEARLAQISDLSDHQYLGFFFGCITSGHPYAHESSKYHQLLGCGPIGPPHRPPGRDSDAGVSLDSFHQQLAPLHDAASFEGILTCAFFLFSDGFLSPPSTALSEYVFRRI